MCNAAQILAEFHAEPRLEYGVQLRPVVYPNNVPGVQERSERAERSEQCSEHSWACSGHVAKISMLRLNIGSGKLSSCMLSIGLGPKCEQGKGGQHPPCLEQLWVLGQS